MGQKRIDYDDHVPIYCKSIPMTKLLTPGKVYYMQSVYCNLYIITSNGIYILNRDWGFDLIPIVSPLYITYVGSRVSIMTTHGMYKCVNYYGKVKEVIKIDYFGNLKDIITFSLDDDKLIVANKHLVSIYDYGKLTKSYPIQNIIDMYYNDQIYIFTKSKYYIVSDTIQSIKCPPFKHYAYYCPYQTTSIILSDNNVMYGYNVNSYGKLIHNTSNKIIKLH